MKGLGFLYSLLLRLMLLNKIAKMSEIMGLAKEGLPERRMKRVVGVLAHRVVVVGNVQG